MKRALILILLVGSGLRLLFLGRRQPWTDELMQALIVREGSLGGLLSHLRTGMWLPAPLDYLAQKLIVLLLGEAPWALRLHAALFGGLTLFVFFRLARRFFGDRVALYSTALLAVFPLHFHFSQEGRPWALFTLISLFCFDHLTAMLVEERRNWRDWAGLSLGLALALYASVHAVALFAAQFAALASLAGRRSTYTMPAAEPGAVESCQGERLSVRPFDLVAYLAAVSAACALYVPWLRYAWFRPGIAGPWEVAGPRLIPRLLKETGDGSYLISAIVLGGVVVGIAALKRHGRGLDLRWLLAWAVVPLPAALVFDIGSGFFFGIEQLLPATPALALLAGYGLSHVGERLAILSRLPYQTSSPAMMYVILLLVSTGWSAQSHWRDVPIDWEGTARQLRDGSRPGDALSMPVVGPLLEYYAPELSAARVTDISPGPGVLSTSSVTRRVVVCGDRVGRDPCAGFREAAVKEKSWSSRQTPGFTIFTREK